MVKLRAPRMTSEGHSSRKQLRSQALRSCLADWVIPTLSVPRQNIRWKNFPDPLTSQPCHLPTAAWIPNAALNPCPAGRQGQSLRAVVLNDAAVSPSCLYLDGNLGCFFNVSRGLYGSFPHLCAHFIPGPLPSSHTLFNNPCIPGHLPRTL